jgi:hypothetical protein
MVIGDHWHDSRIVEPQSNDEHGAIIGPGAPVLVSALPFILANGEIALL